MEDRPLKSWIVSIVFLAACAPAAEPPAPSTTPPPPPVTVSEELPSERSTTAVSTDDGPAQTIEEANITITDVRLENPLVVSGLARTFENNVVLRAKDARGALITEAFTTATGEMGQHSLYRGTLWITRDPGARMTVEALEYSAKDGSETNVARVAKNYAVPLIETTLYFPDEGCTGVKPFVRRLPKSVAMARLLVEALVSGPTQSERSGGATTPFPAGSRAQTVILRDGVLTVDFNERLQNVGGSCRAQMIRAAITETLRRLPTVKSIVITAGGSEKLALQP
jgi:hypothetical protein